LELLPKTMFPELVTTLLKDGYKVSFNAPGHSMYPTIMANESVVVEPVEPLTVERGDIILYRSRGSLFAHRVIGIVRNDKAEEFSSLLEAFSPDVDCPREDAPDTLEKTNIPQDLKLCGASEKLLFILRGDASRTFDEPVKSDQILGKVISIERNGNTVDPYSLQHKVNTWFFKTSLRLKSFLGMRRTSQ
jgi:signal peptidase I